MNTIPPERMFDGFIWLPNQTLAACVYVAARLCLSVWEEFELARHGSKRGKELLDACEKWWDGDLTDEELRESGRRLLALLPRDLKKEDDPIPGYAGWAIQGIATLAVEDCADVSHSIAHSAIHYAAWAVCRSGFKDPLLDLGKFNECERQFLTKWWELCREQNLIPDESR
jgi:hypothetical protein